MHKLIFNLLFLGCGFLVEKLHLVNYSSVISLAHTTITTDAQEHFDMEELMSVNQQIQENVVANENFQVLSKQYSDLKKLC